MKKSTSSPKTSPLTGRRACLVLAAGVFCASSASATTLAYWRFEEGPENGQLIGQTGNLGQARTFALDSSGNGNHMGTWQAPQSPGNTSPDYSLIRPFTIVPQTGATNNFSFAFDGNDDLFSSPSSSLDSFRSLPALTIEASVRFGSIGTWQTFVGKDGRNIPGSQDPNFAGAYFQLVQDPGFNNHVAIKLHQGNGALVSVYTQAPVVAGAWYNFAAVADGTNLSLYSISASGVVTLENSAPFSGNVTFNSTGDWSWTIGRGMYNGQVVDWMSNNSNIDEVRLSAAALGTHQFLATAIPEPSAFAALGGLAALGFAATRRRRA